MSIMSPKAEDHPWQTHEGSVRLEALEKYSEKFTSQSSHSLDHNDSMSTQAGNSNSYKICL